MFIFYDLILFLLAIFYLPYAVFKGKFHRDFILRLGIIPRKIKFNQPIWLHAVSVGEILSSRPLLTRIRQAYPDRQIVISTITSTGNKIAQGLAQDKDFVFYLPLDLSFIVKRVIKRIIPSLCIILETEIWPNLISCLNKESVPTMIVNARLSDRSYKRYKFTWLVFKPILKKINAFCVQTKSDAERFISLGADKDSVKVTGNMKFDVEIHEPESRIQKSDLGLSETDRLIVAGSTHPGEEEIMLNAYKALLAEFPDLKLLLAPRHPERSGEIERLVTARNFEPIFISELLAPKAHPPTAETQAERVFILDTIGQLVSLYGLADVVFIGGSLVNKGGHNVIEPAYFKKAVIIGPYMYNFKDIAECFLKENALASVNNENGLKSILRSLLKDDAQRKALGDKAYRIIQVQQGAAGRNLEQINVFLRQ